MGTVALIDMDLRLPDEPVRDAALDDELERVDCYQLTEVELDRHDGLIVPGMVDQEYLYRQRARIRQYLDRGGVVVFSGQLHRSWLPGAGGFQPKRISSFRDYELTIPGPHPIFAGVEADDLTYRRGVAGFFARGHHPPPKGADVLVTFASGEPVVYLDRVTTGGTILAHAGNDLLGLLGDDSSAGRVPGQLLTWIHDARRRS